MLNGLLDTVLFGLLPDRGRLLLASRGGGASPSVASSGLSDAAVDRILLRAKSEAIEQARTEAQHAQSWELHVALPLEAPPENDQQDPDGSSVVRLSD